MNSNRQVAKHQIRIKIGDHELNLDISAAFVAFAESEREWIDDKISKFYKTIGHSMPVRSPDLK